MRFIGRLSSAVPRSNSGRASGCVFPFRISRRDSSTAAVIRGRWASEEWFDCCAYAGAGSQNVQRERKRQVPFMQDTKNARIGTPLPGIKGGRSNGGRKVGTPLDSWAQTPTAAAHYIIEMFFSRISI